MACLSCVRCTSRASTASADQLALVAAGACGEITWILHHPSAADRPAAPQMRGGKITSKAEGGVEKKAALCVTTNGSFRSTILCARPWYATDSMSFSPRSYSWERQARRADHRRADSAAHTNVNAAHFRVQGQCCIVIGRTSPSSVFPLQVLPKFSHLQCFQSTDTLSPGPL